MMFEQPKNPKKIRTAKNAVFGVIVAGIISILVIVSQCIASDDNGQGTDPTVSAGTSTVVLTTPTTAPATAVVPVPTELPVTGDGTCATNQERAILNFLSVGGFLGTDDSNGDGVYALIVADQIHKVRYSVIKRMERKGLIANAGDRFLAAGDCSATADRPS